jgi:hypothetical protein
VETTFTGAAQTLDGIRWKNVTFARTRLHPDGGEVALQNVRFANCALGFSADERGGAPGGRDRAGSAIVRDAVARDGSYMARSTEPLE